jgi:hypothetical protein
MEREEAVIARQRHDKHVSEATDNSSNNWGRSVAYAGVCGNKATPNNTRLGVFSVVRPWLCLEDEHASKQYLIVCREDCSSLVLYYRELEKYFFALRETMVSAFCWFAEERIYLSSSLDVQVQRNNFLWQDCVIFHNSVVKILWIVVGIVAV